MLNSNPLVVETTQAKNLAFPFIPVVPSLIDSKNSELYTMQYMKDAVQRINVEYGLNLTEEEIETITKQVEAGQRLFSKLYEVDVDGVSPALKIDPAEKK